MTGTITVPGVPFALTPSAGSTWSTDPAAGTLAVTADPHSDIFVDPAGPGLSAGGDAGEGGGIGGQVNAETLMNAVTLLAEAPEGDFQLRARVRVGFESTFDAGVLLLWLNREYWAKLCFEFSPDREAMVVSVVNRGVADDANAFVVEGGEVWLRVSRIGRVFAYHASLDGSRWKMVRAFALESPGAAARIGFEAQAPTGDGCDVVFSDISFTTGTLADLRDGS
jgi:regulation of enolase protein 1 (concanavalin A-like superfamily)